MNIFNQMRCRLADLRGRGVYAGWPNDNRAIFIHLPKTAGTSVSEALGLHAARHVLIEDYKNANATKFASFFKFAFVRNPFDRLLSGYTFLRTGGMNENDARFAEIHVKPYESFEHFVTQGFALDPQIRAWVHFRPQTDFICDAQGRNQLDFTGRFERIAEDYAEIAARLGKSGALPITNRSPRGDYREVYTPPTVDMVKHFYATDLETFEYGFD